MSRGGRGGGRGRGGGGRGGFGASNLPPMGLSFADIQNMSREATQLYPPMDPLPVLTSYTDEERLICELQDGFARRLKRSAYYVIERTKTDELPRYSDKYRPSPATQPTLKKGDLHQQFFPPEIFQDYFNPKRKKKGLAVKKSSKRTKLDTIEGDEDVDDKSSEAASEIGSQEEASDYDVDEEYDNDYAENYFDNGEGDDFEDLGGGGGGDDGGGGGDFD